MKHTQEQVLTALRKLPPQTRQFIVSVEAAEAIAKIGIRYQLTREQTTKLGGEAGLRMMNLYSKEDFLSILEQELSINKNNAALINADIEMLAKDNEGFIPTEEDSTNLNETLSSLKSAPVTPTSIPQAPVASQPTHIPVAAAPEPMVVPMPVSSPMAQNKNIPAGHTEDNLPVVQEEREVAIRKIVTPNPLLNKQIEVPVARPIMPAPTPKPQPVVNPPLKEVPESPKAVDVTSLGQRPLPSKGEPTPNIIDSRLGKAVSIPKENVDFTAKKQHDEVQYPPRYTTNDPYREPIE